MMAVLFRSQSRNQQARLEDLRRVRATDCNGESGGQGAGCENADKREGEEAETGGAGRSFHWGGEGLFSLQCGAQGPAARKEAKAARKEAKAARSGGGPREW